MPALRSLAARAAPHLARLAARTARPLVELAGAALVVCCVALYEPRLAVGLAGLILVAVANARP